MPGYFIALVVIGDKEAAETDLYIQLCSDYMQELYRKTASGYGGKWLMLEVTCEAVLQDVKGLIEMRRKYDPKLIGYEWDDAYPRIQLEPREERGYIELRAVKQAAK